MEAGPQAPGKQGLPGVQVCHCQRAGVQTCRWEGLLQAGGLELVSRGCREAIGRPLPRVWPPRAPTRRAEHDALWELCPCRRAGANGEPGAERRITTTSTRDAWRLREMTGVTLLHAQFPPTGRSGPKSRPFSLT